MTAEFLASADRILLPILIVLGVLYLAAIGTALGFCFKSTIPRWCYYASLALTALPLGLIWSSRDVPMTLFICGTPVIFVLMCGLIHYYRFVK